MATEIEIKAKLDTLRSLPPRLEKLSGCLGTVNWPGQGKRLNFPSGMELTADERSQSISLLAELRAVIDGTNLEAKACSKARYSLLTKMLMSYPMAASASVEQSSARQDMYLEALDDMPPWAISNALKRWNKGECTDIDMGNLNYNFAPAPAILRALCKAELRPLELQAAKLKRLLSAVPIDRAMDPKPIELEQERLTYNTQTNVIPKLRLL
jgi:hypothetical protein